MITVPLRLRAEPAARVRLSPGWDPSGAANANLSTSRRIFPRRRLARTSLIRQAKMGTRLALVFRSRARALLLHKVKGASSAYDAEAFVLDSRSF